ncbi:MAG: hypothetical protein ACOVQ5_10365 [Flavobacteriales bacterium]|jgi:glycosyltransferase involved in cell wall biosynthesis
MIAPILFFVSDFYPGGAQREMYELDVELKKRGIQITILCLRDLNTSKVFTDHYYKLHQTLGTSIVFYNDLRYKKNPSTLDRIKNKLGLNKPFDLNEYLSQFSKVIYVGEYTFQAIYKSLRISNQNVINMITVCTRFQGERYRDFNKSHSYNFIDGFDDRNQVAFEYEGFSNYHTYCLPLSFEPTHKYYQWKFRNLENKKIAIFTRLSKAKPLDPFLYAFSILKEKHPKLELHIFGAGDADEAEYTRYIKHLDIKDVFFRGHLDQMKEKINEENIDLVWFQGYLNRPAGYAGFDVALTGVPQLFWDFYSGENPNINRLDYTYPHYKSITKFAQDSESVLSNEEIATSISTRQFEDTLNNRDMSKNIMVLKDILPL